jgi:polycomb protein SUZ12
VDTHQEPVKVETLLLKICHKKRKDVSSPIMQVSMQALSYDKEQEAI